MIRKLFSLGDISGTDPELLKKNEYEVNLQHQLLGYLFLGICFLAIIFNWIIDDEEYDILNLFAVLCCLFTFACYLYINKIIPLNSKRYKYVYLSLIFIPFFIWSILSVNNYWLLYAIPVLMSCRYHKIKVVFFETIAAQVALFATSILIVLYQPMFGYADAGAVLFRDEMEISVSPGMWMNELAAKLLESGQIRRWDYFSAYYSTHIIYYALILLGVSMICFLTTIQEVKNLRIQSEILTRQRQMDLELSDSRYRIMISQIQPHFIFNVLNSVYELCESDPDMAQEMLLDFSSYLRHDIDTLASSDAVLVSKELDAVNHYLRLEQIRFGDRLKVQMDIQTTNFRILPLTIQPLVENAVKHGICKKKDGGTIWIRTREMDEGYQIQVEDDGVGFVVGDFSEIRENHIGLPNVKLRLEKQMHGELKVESVPDQGTRVTILIPRENPM